MADKPAFDPGADYTKPKAAFDPNAAYGTLAQTTRQPAGGQLSPAARQGAYQQSPGGDTHNALSEAANPFSDTTTSVLPDMLGTKQQGAITRREGESDSQLMARVREAAKTVKPSAIEVEHRRDIASTIPTLGAAVAAGPTALAGAAGAAEVPGLTQAGYGALKQMASTPAGKEAIKFLLKATLGAELYRHRHLLDLL